MENKLDYYAIRGYKKFVEIAHANVTITNKCNNSCYYCNGGFDKPRKRYDFLTKHQFSELIELLLIQGRPKISMTIIGGEPTIHKDFPHFLNETEKIDRETYIYIVTNLLKSYEYFKSLPLKKSFDFICSYHSNGIKDDDEWFSKVDLLYKKRCLSKVFLMLTEKNIDKIKKVHDKYKGKYIKDGEDLLTVYPINEFAYGKKFKELSDSGTFNYFNTHVDCQGDQELNSKNVKVLLSDGTNDYLNYDKYRSFYFMMCHCALAVHPNGRVTRCLHDLAPVIVLGRDKLKKLPEWHLCRQKKCICDLEYPKCSVDYYMKHFKKG